MKRKIFAHIGRKIAVPMAAVAIVGGAMFPQVVSAKAPVSTERSWENWQMSEDQTKYTMTQAQKGKHVARDSGQSGRTQQRRFKL